jgi:hypothetical protein
MNLENHYKIGNRIYGNLAEQNIFLNRRAFLFGNLAPDISFSFLLWRHQYASTASWVKRITRRLYQGFINPGALSFSFYLGIVIHFLCDYFCYSHQPSFKGGLIDHMRYEEEQIFSAGKTNPLRNPSKPVRAVRDFEELSGILDRCVSRHEKLRRENIKMKHADIPLAIALGTWLSAAVYLGAEKSNDGNQTPEIPGWEQGLEGILYHYTA